MYTLISSAELFCHLFIQQIYTESLLFADHIIVLTETFLRNFHLSWTFRSHIRELVTSSLNFLKSAFIVGHIWTFIIFSSLGIKTQQSYFLPNVLSLPFFFSPPISGPKEHCWFQKVCMECFKKFSLFNIFLSLTEFRFKLLIRFKFVNKCYFPNLVEIILEIFFFFSAHLIPSNWYLVIFSVKKIRYYLCITKWP